MSIIKPTAVIWKTRAKNSIKSMLDKVSNSNIELRPHFKTHQSSILGEWFREEGVNKITVSSVEMAVYFANHNWRDITIAFPINILEIQEINSLAMKLDSLNLLVENTESIECLENKLTKKVKIWIKIDIGYKRTGIYFENFKEILVLVIKMKKTKNLEFIGLLTHAGHTYTQSNQRKREIFFSSLKKMTILKQNLDREGFSNVKLSYGDTPSCSIIENFKGFDEIRPGNFVLYDLTQFTINSCEEKDISIAIACPIVAKHKDRMEIIIYGGGVHFSKDYLKVDDSSESFYGYLVEKNADGTWGEINKTNYLKSINQEHRIFQQIH
ncbi:MAG: D-threo-3-hydroxyaspartate dehydratase [Candidatus Heimdallarchaeota archaeon LC_3]|nr:MAG: D-threo-3-hydroxyaspartate dehydratase [Candidatus Heimdallarchaeota archaeon LC_3]